MNSSRIAKALFVLASLSTAACTPVDTTMGGAFKHDVVMQTIDPDPTYDGQQIEGGDGVHAAAATDRYYKGTVKQPATITTRSSGSGGSGTGSGSAGSSSTPN